MDGVGRVGTRRLDINEALRRVRLITPMLRLDVRRAVLSRAILEAANETIAKGLKGIQTEFSGSYNAGQHALAMMLALDLARIFDLSEGGRYPPEEQDKASIPVLAALIGRQDVQAELVREAGNWLGGIGHVVTAGSAPPGVLEEALKSMEEEHRSGDREDCRKAIGDFLTAARRLEVEGEHKAALVRIRQFRNRRLAHSLFDKEPDELPRYADLFLLLGLAEEATRHALFCVEGHSIDFSEQAENDRENADGYYARVLDGLKRAATGGDSVESNERH